jgi:hypothetical protein
VPFIETRLQHVEGDADRQAVVEAVAGQVGGAVVCREDAQRVALELVGGVGRGRVDGACGIDGHREIELGGVMIHLQMVEHIGAVDACLAQRLAVEGERDRLDAGRKGFVPSARVVKTPSASLLTAAGVEVANYVIVARFEHVDDDIDRHRIEETVAVRVHCTFVADAQEGRRLRHHGDEQAVETHDVAFRGLDDDLEIGIGGRRGELRGVEIVASALSPWTPSSWKVSGRSLPSGSCTVAVKAKPVCSVPGSSSTPVSRVTVSPGR